MDFPRCLHVIFVVCMVFHTLTAIPVSFEKEKDSIYWNNMAKDELNKAINNNDPIVGVAKNVILFLGDGMSVPTVTASRILAGQMKGENGEENSLTFDRFPNVALSKTYNVDHQTPDSAGTGTAYLCGVKTNMGVIGVNAHVTMGNCSSAPASTHLSSILKWSLAKGKSAGVVTTTRVTHATPASTYANTPNRNWENSVPADQQPHGCKDIASQLIEDNPDISVILGGGRKEFLPNMTVDPEGGTLTDARPDGRDLIQLWQQTQAKKSRSYRYVWNETDFNAVDPKQTDYLLGLFDPSHMHWETDRAQDIAGEPHIKEMTRKAIQILQKNDKGFFLLVEGGSIDLAHHKNLASKALHDTIAMAQAVGVADSMLDEKDTLIVVTADHSHTFAFAGYPMRGNNILGIAKDLSWGVSMGQDGKPFTTLLYGNGPGYNGLQSWTLAGRQNVSNVNTSSKAYAQQTAVPTSSETHGGEDVAIYARGPMAHLFHGVHEQNYIAHVMAYASCVGAYSNDKDCARSKVANGQTNLTNGRWSWLLVLMTMVLMKK